MKKFKIQPMRRWYDDTKLQRKILAYFINQPVDAFFHADYHAGDAHLRNQRGTIENIITSLKNQYKDISPFILTTVSHQLIDILKSDLVKILNKVNESNLTVCVVPRAKAQTFYTPSQLLFKFSIKQAVEHIDGLIDGTDFILRHSNTKTTHLAKSGYGGDGDMPYPGITKDTCHISPLVQGRHILLIDDLYTEFVNIDEDAIQALLDHGAASVRLYTLGRTKIANQFNEGNRLKLFKLTLRETFDLMSQGCSIDQICELRGGLTVSTIINHIFEIADILGPDIASQYRPSDEILYAVKHAVEVLGQSQQLKPIYLELNESVSYNDIKLSLIFIDEI